MKLFNRTPTTATAPAAAGSNRFVELDGYRGLAAALIVLFHSWQQGRFPYSDTSFKTVMFAFPMAVSLFFALSGMVIFLPMVRGALNGNVPAGRPFLVRRLYRILPIYFLLIVLVWSARYNGTTDAWHDLLRHLTFTQDYSKHGIFWTIGPAWSLAAEIHYYLIIALLGPPLARLAARRSTLARRLATLAILPAALLIASLVYKWIVYYGMHVDFTSWFTYYNPLARADSFAMGMLLAIGLSIPGVLKPRPRLAVALTALGAAALVPIALKWLMNPPMHLYYYALAGICAMLLLAGAMLVHPGQRLSRVLRHKTLQGWATISLSMYLVHEPIMLTLTKYHILYFLDPTWWPISSITLLLTSTVAGWFLYKYVEVPGMRLQKVIDRLRSRQLRPALRRSGPPPRWLPDLVLATPEGIPVQLRDLPRDRPILMAFEQDRGRRLAEQRFRLDAHEADGFYITSTTPKAAAPPGTKVLIDADGRLTAAFNDAAALIEVSPAGLITATHEITPTRTEVAR